MDSIPDQVIIDENFLEEIDEKCLRSTFDFILFMFEQISREDLKRRQKTGGFLLEASQFAL